MNGSGQSVALITAFVRRIRERTLPQGREIVFHTIQKVSRLFESRTPSRAPKTPPIPPPARWTRESVLALKKKAYGNFGSDELFDKVSRLCALLNHHEKVVLGRRKRQEWQEIEKLADEISAQMQRLTTRR